MVIDFFPDDSRFSILYVFFVGMLRDLSVICEQILMFFFFERVFR